jgi:protein Tex
VDVNRINELQSELQTKLQNINKLRVSEEIGVGVPTLELIIENLLKPGRDPRESLPKPLLRSDLLRMEDLSVGDTLEGTVRNVVDFGAFVDIGVKQDGLLHISKMLKDGNKVQNPHDLLSVGDIIKVAIDSIDAERGRISLTMA